MRIKFTQEGVARARRLVAGYEDSRIRDLHDDGLRRLTGDDRDERSTFPEHERSDTCACKGCFQVCFDIVQDEYQLRFDPAVPPESTDV